MIRTQIYLEEELHARVRSIARVDGRSGASVIREAVRRYVDDRDAQRGEVEDPFADLIGAFSGGPADAAEHHDRYLYGSDR